MNLRTAQKPWHLPDPGYTPVDITPPELHTDALTDPDEWVTDPTSTPQEVTDWPARQAAALVPFTTNDAGYPLNPTGRTGRTGRNLGRWGENQAADPIVIAGTGTGRKVLLVRRDDTHQWAIPGGMVDPGETAPAALTRELLEETGVDLRHTTPHILDRTYVDDPRNTDHAWVTTTVALYELPTTVPTVAGDDAEDARWWPWTGNVHTLAATLKPHGGLYTPHHALLTTAQKALR